MPLQNQKRYLAVLDVGHGSAAVLRDEGGVVVFDAGRGAHVNRHLQSLGIYDVEAMFLSHADSDHIGGAITLLLNKGVRIGLVYLNPDPSKKDSAVFGQLRYALSEAQEQRGTRLDPSLTTSTKVVRKGASIEILFPPANVALGGVGGRNLSGARLTSNSLSAAIRVNCGAKSSVLLGGDIDFDCLDEWKKQGLRPAANALVFPHHGGAPGAASEAALFAHELIKLVQPDFVVFSIHRTKFGLPRDDVLNAVKMASKEIRFLCTQLPERFQVAVQTDEAWASHRDASGRGYIDGNVVIDFTDEDLKPTFCQPD